MSNLNPNLIHSTTTATNNNNNNINNANNAKNRRALAASNFPQPLPNYPLSAHALHGQAVEQLTSLGFSVEQAKRALLDCQNDVNLAANKLLSR